MSKLKTNAKKPTPVDEHIGRKIRLLRKANSVSQEQLGDVLGITFQQIQKYENGTNRVGSGRLQEIADFFRTNIEYFFPQRGGDQNDQLHELADIGDAVELVRMYNKINDPNTRKFVLEIVRLAASSR